MLKKKRLFASLSFFHMSFQNAGTCVLNFWFHCSSIFKNMNQNVLQYTVIHKFGFTSISFANNVLFCCFFPFHLNLVIFQLFGNFTKHTLLALIFIMSRNFWIHGQMQATKTFFYFVIDEKSVHLCIVFPLVVRCSLFERLYVTTRKYRASGCALWK